MNLSSQNRAQKQEWERVVGWKVKEREIYKCFLQDGEGEMGIFVCLFQAITKTLGQSYLKMEAVTISYNSQQLLLGGYSDTLPNNRIVYTRNSKTYPRFQALESTGSQTWLHVVISWGSLKEIDT